MSKILKNHEEKTGIVGQVTSNDAINIIIESSVIISNLHFDKSTGNSFELRLKNGDSGGLFILALYNFGRNGFNLFRPTINKSIHEKLLEYGDLLNK